jgi:hypothetical protein
MNHIYNQPTVICIVLYCILFAIIIKEYGVSTINKPLPTSLYHYNSSCFVQKNIIGFERNSEQDDDDLLHKHINLTNLGIFQNTYYLILMLPFIFLM